MKLQELLSLMVIHEHNFRVIHWNCIGKKFDKIHSITKEYYEMLSDDQDIVAEMAMRCGEKCVGYSEAEKILSEYSDKNFKIISSEEMFDYKKFCDDVSQMLDDICYGIGSVLEEKEISENISNVGIKATLEGLYDRYDLQKRFIHTRRSSDKDSDDE